MDDITSYRLRPSVSIIPIKNKFYEFFQSNTRRVKHLKFSDEDLIRAISSLSGKSISSISNKNPHLKTQIESLFNALYEWCLIEDVSIADRIESNKFRRVLNFLADYFPSQEIFPTFDTIQNSTILIVGLGGVGSWVAIGLAQSGVNNFILCDPDVVKRDNLNRSLFFEKDIGKPKIDAITDKIYSLGNKSNVIRSYAGIEHKDDVLKLINSDNSVDLVINCADYPSVDRTSEVIGKACMEEDIPHIISGGYNLHLSLIGPTIIPNETACYNCIEIELTSKKPDDFNYVKKLYRKNRNIGNIAPLAGISASFSINEAIRILAKNSRLKPQMANKRGEFNFLTSQVTYTHYERNKNCSWCGNL